MMTCVVSDTTDSNTRLKSEWLPGFATAFSGLADYDIYLNDLLERNSTGMAGPGRRL
jgi:hypothetical protein